MGLSRRSLLKTRACSGLAASPIRSRNPSRTISRIFAQDIPGAASFAIRGFRCSTISNGLSGSGIFAPDSESLSPETPYAKAKFGYQRESIQMISLLGIVNIVGSATEQALRYLGYHHWFFGIILIGYIFRLHDKSIHARFSAFDRRVDAIRRRLACDI